MNIWIGAWYYVTIKTDGAHLNEEREFVDFKSKETSVIDGGSLLDLISNCLKDREMFSFTVKDNKIIFEHFNPQTGESYDSEIEIEEYKEEKWD